MYGFPLLYGNPRTALNDPFSAVLTEETAMKYFGRTNVLGESLTIESFSGTQHDFLITGVLKKLTPNSVTSIDDNNRIAIFLSSAGIDFFGRVINSWNNPWIIAYIELKAGVTPVELEKLMLRLVKQNTQIGISDQLKPILVPLKDYYLEANNGLVKKMLSTLAIIAIFILFMAIVNFINIAVSRSSGRMREIGVRKVLGGMRKQLIFQLLTESFLLVMLSTIIALGMYELFRPVFNNLLDTKIPALYAFPAGLYGILLALILLISVLAGIYPALVLSSLRPAEVIKGSLNAVKENILFRKLLVTFQFSIAAIVLIGAILIAEQVDYFLNGNLGYDKSYIISAQVPRDWTRKGVAHMEIIRDEFAGMPQIDNVSLSYEIPDGGFGDMPNAFKPGQDSTQAKSVGMLKCDAAYLSTYKIPLVAGTFFTAPDKNTDSTKIVMNETAARAFGWEDPTMAIGRQLKFQGYGTTIFTITGVTKDFQFGSMQEKIGPIIFFHVNYLKQYRYFSFRMKPGNINSTIESLQKKWSSLMPGTPFQYRFMDDILRKIYKTEIQLKQASYIATGLTCIIVLLGVLGLVSLSIEKRRKEIGIRKVLGSSVAGIILLFVREFSLVILFAGIIAWPLAYMIVQKWLNGYAYRINVTAQPFLFSIVLLALITALLIILQSIKAATANPVKCLKAE
jgi:ABC-type antimicrobial peptide transport system permease subunit